MALNGPLLSTSLELVASREPQITKRFYTLLFQRYPQSQALFGRNPREGQERMLQEAIIAVVEHVDDSDWLVSNLRGLGAKHAGYGVTEEMYPWVGECLLATLAEIAGDDWSPEIDKAWTDAYGAIVGLMLQGAAA